MQSDRWRDRPGLVQASLLKGTCPFQQTDAGELDIRMQKQNKTVTLNHR